jgi:phosphoribosylglycinamide formyltransferase 1
LKPTIVVLASGSGSNFQSILRAIDRGEVDAKVVRLIASRPGIGAIEKAHAANIPSVVIQKSSFKITEDFEAALIAEIQTLNPDLIVLAGYLVQIPVSLICMFPGRIINIHPSLLPDFGGKGFYGLKVHEAVIKSGKKITGCTVHVVTDNYDEGPILAQRTVSVDADDTPESLAKKVLELEHTLLPETIQTILKKTVL